MKLFSLGLLAAVAGMIFGPSALAQYKGPRDYFPKRYPAPPAGGQAVAPKTPDKKEPAKAPPPKFKDLPVNGQFYFLSDTNRAYAWTKDSTSTAKNTKNGVTRSITGETPVQK